MRTKQNLNPRPPYPRSNFLGLTLKTVNRSSLLNLLSFMNICFCMCLCLCIYMFVYVYVYARTCIYVCMCIWVYTDINNKYKYILHNFIIIFVLYWLIFGPFPIICCCYSDSYTLLSIHKWNKYYLFISSKFSSLMKVSFLSLLQSHILVR